MSEPEWKEVYGRRVALVPSRHGHCALGECVCPFLATECYSICNENLPAPHRDTRMFITEDQLPEYLAARLLGET